MERTVFDKNQKAGFTLIEVLVVVAMIGILSGIGVAALRDAVINNRVRGEARSLAAFYENVSSRAKQIADTLCVIPSGTQILARSYVKGACTGAALDSFALEPGFSVAALSGFASVPGFSSQGDAKNWNATDVAIFYPRIGLMNISGEGYIVVQYSDRYGAVAKVRTDNKILSFASYDGGSSWDRL